jgi:hypothetical protein
MYIPARPVIPWPLIQEEHLRRIMSIALLIAAGL